MLSLLENAVRRLRDWLASHRVSSSPADPEIRAEVRSHLRERRAELSHWLFMLRTGFALGLAGYLSFGALVGAGTLPVAVLWAAAYAAVNIAVRVAGGRHFHAAPWAYGLIDVALVFLLCGPFPFSAAFNPAPFGPNVALVGLLALTLLIYTVLGAPKLNIVLSLASLGALATMLYVVPDLVARRAPTGATPPIRSFLLVEYLSIACLVTCLLSLRLRRRILAHSAELHRRMTAAVEGALEHKRRQELEEVNRLKRDFIAVLSHELRNPVAPLVSSLDIAQADLRAHDDGACDPELIEVATDAAHELQDLISDYTRLAELLNRPLDETNRWNIPLRSLVETLTEQLDGARFVFEDLRDWRVAGDPSMLSGALHAIMRRATHHTPDDRLVTVRAGDASPADASNAANPEDANPEDANPEDANPEDAAVCVAVHDPCSYLEPDMIETLNDLFAPSQERLFSKSTTGMELTLAQHALQRIGGRLRAESSREDGTTVYCLLPPPSSELPNLTGASIRTLCTEHLPGKSTATTPAAR